MPATIEDLKPKNIKVRIEGVELECKPLRLSHALTLAKVGNLFQSPGDSSMSQVKEAENELDELFGELIPELSGIKLGMAATTDLIDQLLKSIEPSDNKELNEMGVKFNNDPKAQERNG